MLKIDDRENAPKDAHELVGNTRENARDLVDYEAVVKRLGMPTVREMISGTRLLEVGTGKGNSLSGFLDALSGKGHVASLDLDQETLAGVVNNSNALAKSYLWDHKIPARDASDFPVIDLSAGDVAATNFPEKYFDTLISIWVFYQVKDKLAGLQSAINALKPGGKGMIAAGGSVCVVDRRAAERVDWQELREFVWNHRSSRFSWLSGIREASHYLTSQDIPHKILSLGAAVQEFLGTKVTIFPASNSEQPDGHFIFQKELESQRIVSAPKLASFVSTRNSAFVPIYLGDL